MSETVTPPASVVPPSSARNTPESLQSQTFLVSMYLLTILSGVLVGVFMVHDLTPLQGSIAGSVVGAILGGLGGYYFAASKHPAASDAAPTTTTVTAPPATVTTTTGPTP